MVTTPDVRELVIDLLVTSSRFTRLAARESSSTIPRALWRALAQFDELGSMRVSELAAADRISQPTATALVQRLGERGWVERSADPDDARAVRVRISPAGRAALDENRHAAADALAPRLERLDPQALHALSVGVAALRAVLAADAPEDTDAADADAASTDAASAHDPRLENA